MFQALKKNSHSTGAQGLQVQAHTPSSLAYKLGQETVDDNDGTGGTTTWHLM